MFDLRKSSRYSALEGIDQKLRDIFSQIKDEFEDHLISINENTNEIQSVYQYVAQIDSKIERLGQRIDQIQLFLQQNHSFKAEEKPVFYIKPLTKKEQEIFLVLYTLEEKGAVTYTDIARLTALTEDIVSSYITSIMEKGVPIIKKYVNNKPYLKLDQRFKELQTKENILGIEQTTFKNFNL